MHKARIMATIVAAAWLVLGNSVNAMSQSYSDVIQALRSADQQMNAGVVRFTLYHKTIAPRMPTRIENRRATMTYLPNGAFKLAMRDWSSGKAVDWSEVCDGQDYAFEYPRTKTSQSSLTIMPGKASELMPYSHWVEMTPAASIPLGRGLSVLHDIQVAHNGNTLIIKGTASDNTRISAVLDSQHGYVMKSMIRTGPQGRIYNDWRFGHAVRVANGPFVASWSNGTGHFAGGEGIDISNYKLISANFARQNIRVINLTIPPGDTAVDGRLGKFAAINNNSSIPLTKEALLPYTQRQLALIAEQHRENEMYKQHDQRRHMALVAVPIALVCTCIALGLFVFWRKRQAL